MGSLFNLEDIFNVMIELESLGNRHYTKMKTMTNQAGLMVLFDRLAQDELAHKALYETFKKDMVHASEIKVDEEYEAYMKTLLDHTIRFLKEGDKVDEFNQGFDLAVNLEKDTILFLNELMNLVEPRYHEAIDRVIVQERIHLKNLYDFKNDVNWS